MQVSILNYGVGNLYSLQAALKREGVTPRLTSNIRKAEATDGLLLPGVGSFQEATRKLPRNKIRDMIINGKPVFGICLGLQLLFDRSDEGPGKGLALFPGRVKRLPSIVKVPQIGWNTLKIKRHNEFVDQVQDDTWVYYVHSYYPSTNGDWITATSKYGVEYPTIVAQKNVLGTQFHPEKSGSVGRVILRNFIQSIKR
ncbi:MAG: imidazole glycerol phosphate synthase subunit HisH [Candidatus Bathyarchaeia archaeon]